MSAPMRRAQRKSAISFSDSAGTLTATPGKLKPLLSDTRPPSITRVTTRGPSTATTSRVIRPSSTSTRSPGCTSPGSPKYVVETMEASPGTTWVVTVNSAPTSSSTAPDAKRPSRIFGPCRSTRTPTPRPASSAPCRTAAYASVCSACSPCERFRRATSMPAAIRSRILSKDEVAGPNVTTIFARRML